jgi:hypothetical protein
MFGPESKTINNILLPAVVQAAALLCHSLVRHTAIQLYAQTYKKKRSVVYAPLFLSKNHF